MREIPYFQAINEAIAQEMELDEKVFVIGESIRGGQFPHTEGLVHKFGKDRVLDTPVSETALSGAGLGAAMAGYRPIVDLMFIDFMYVAGDELLLKTPQWRFLHGGQVEIPMVLLASAGGGGYLANEHSQVPSSPILHNPGIKLALPSNPYDAKGLLTTAIRDNNPVFYLWHKALMAATGDVPEEDYAIPFGEADIKREGTDVTVVAISNMVNLSLQVAQQLEGQVSVEVIDPRTLEPFDLDTVLASVAKTNRLVVVDEDTERCGFGAELGFLVQQKAFDDLDAPIERVCAKNYPIAGGFMEQHVLPQPGQIKAAIEKVMA